MSKMDEIIVVAPRKAIFGEKDELAFQGTEVDGNARTIIQNLASNTSHMRRGDAEEDPTFKQPIPYGILTSDDRDGELRVFVYKRLTGGGEARLHGKLSIGVGGHMNTLFTPETFTSVILDEAKRELTEELSFDSVEGEVDVTTYPVNIIGLINDDSTPVNKVHLGILYTIESNPNHGVSVREIDQLEGDWMTLPELEEVADRLEDWSKIALDALKRHA